MGEKMKCRVHGIEYSYTCPFCEMEEEVRFLPEAERDKRIKEIRKISKKRRSYDTNTKR